VAATTPRPTEREIRRANKLASNWAWGRKRMGLKPITSDDEATTLLVDWFVEARPNLRFVRDEGRWHLATGSQWAPDSRQALYTLRREKLVRRIKGRRVVGLAERALRAHPVASVATQADLTT
jgi:hypothetical protein